MSHERLQKILQDLRSELGTAEALTEKDRSLLTGVVDQIRGVLSEYPPGEDESVLAVIDEAAIHFEAEHPRLTRTLYQISELLRSAGLS
ncbi:MAG: DUF4404 family protein [Rhodothermales bacterium]